MHIMNRHVEADRINANTAELLGILCGNEARFEQALELVKKLNSELTEMVVTWAIEATDEDEG